MFGWALLHTGVLVGFITLMIAGLAASVEAIFNRGAGQFVTLASYSSINQAIYMRCPFCGAMDTKVIDSRLSGDNDQIRRRRECLECQERFTTYENAELNLPRVVKSDGSREPFSEKKLLAG